MTPDHQRGDALSILKRAITQANAPTLTTQQETDITALITAYKSSLPSSGVQKMTHTVTKKVGPNSIEQRVSTQNCSKPYKH